MTGTITLPNGITLPMAQAFGMGDVFTELGDEKKHWHFNECGCCLTVHGMTRSAIVNSDGDITWYEGRGCGCSDDVQGQTA